MAAQEELPEPLPVIPMVCPSPPSPAAPPPPTTTPPEPPPSLVAMRRLMFDTDDAKLLKHDHSVNITRIVHSIKKDLSKNVDSRSLIDKEEANSVNIDVDKSEDLSTNCEANSSPRNRQKLDQCVNNFTIPASSSIPESAKDINAKKTSPCSYEEEDDLVDNLSVKETLDVRQNTLSFNDDNNILRVDKVASHSDSDANVQPKKATLTGKKNVDMPEKETIKTSSLETKPFSNVEETASSAVVENSSSTEKENVNRTKSIEYPSDLNPFGDSDDESTKEKVETSKASTNPFGSDSEEEEELPKPPPRVTPRKMSASMRSTASTNPFDSDEDDDVESTPVPLPRQSQQSSPEPTPFPRRSKLRTSARSITSLSSIGSYSSTSPRKKRPAPPPPTQSSTLSPSSRYSSVSSLNRPRKNKRAPLPPSPAPALQSKTADSTPDTSIVSEDNTSIPQINVVSPLEGDDKNAKATGELVAQIEEGLQRLMAQDSRDNDCELPSQGEPKESESLRAAVPAETESLSTVVPTETQSITVMPAETKFPSTVLPTETEFQSPVVPIETEFASPVVPTETEFASPVVPTETEFASPVVPTETEFASPVVPTETEFQSPVVPIETQFASSVVPTETEFTSRIAPTETESLNVTPTETEFLSPLVSETEPSLKVAKETEPQPMEIDLQVSPETIENDIKLTASSKEENDSINVSSKTVVDENINGSAIKEVPLDQNREIKLVLEDQTHKSIPLGDENMPQVMLIKEKNDLDGELKRANSLENIQDSENTKNKNTDELVETYNEILLSNPKNSSVIEFHEIKRPAHSTPIKIIPSLALLDSSTEDVNSGNSLIGISNLSSPAGSCADISSYQESLASPPTEKKYKESANMHRKFSESGVYNPHKSTYGQWKRKKAPAPPLPIPQRRAIKPMAIQRIRQELSDIEIKQQELERQGVTLEQKIREKFDSDTSITPYLEDLVLQLFELVNEKNELFRKQAELMYIRRQNQLEEEHAELEYQIRCLMARPEANKTDSDKELEEKLIQRLVEVVERRDAIVQCLEMDRLREVEEDKSINNQLDRFTRGIVTDDRMKIKKKHKKKKDKHNTLKMLDLDKDFDETEKESRKKKKWYTLHHKVAKNS